MKRALILIFFSLALFFLPGFIFSVNNLTFASQSEGTIDSTYKYAWGENIGWINFGCDGCDVVITDSSITGYAWSTQYGWINLNPTTSGVINDGEGTLSGFAWSSNLGWINFTGVTINTDGEFLGYATVKSDNSQINFNCVNALSCSSADFKVKTDWIPASTRPVAVVEVQNSSGSAPNSSLLSSPIIPSLLSPYFSPIVPTPEIVSDILNYTSDFLSYLWGGKEKLADNTLITVPKIAPFSLNGEWNILPAKSIASFVFAPLPYEIRILAAKFPELGKTLKDVGVERFSDMNKLSGVSLNIPGLTDILDKTIKNVGLENMSDINNISGVTLGVPGITNEAGSLPTNVGVGKISLIQGLPIAKFSLSAKKNLPTEFVFARTAGELIDLKVDLAVADKGQVTQQMSALPGQTLKLVVKPISKASSVTGYIIFKSATPKITKSSILRSSLSASVLFSMNELVETVPTRTSPPAPLLNKERVATGPGEVNSIEKKLVLSSFEYLDPDKDGIYTADVVTPVVPGEYEIITVIDYIDPVLGSRKMSMIAVIDPEGYVFEKNNGKETRIPSAIVSLYSLNNQTKKYELWNAGDYSQDNPQVTDIRGTYSFLVPAGSYYFHVEAPGYKAFEGKAFVVVEGNSIHQNIELNSGSKWLSGLDWQTILLIVVFLLLVYNSVRSRPRQ